MRKKYFALLFLIYCFLCNFCVAQSEKDQHDLKIIILPDANPRIIYGAEQLQKTLLDCDKNTVIVKGDCKKPVDNTILVGTAKDGDIFKDALKSYEAKKEGFALICQPNQRVIIAGVDESGVLYGCLELAERIKSQNGKFPQKLNFYDSPVIELRGPCIGLQKPELLYDNVMYDYPYLPETFPWFYDKELWINYLNLLAKHRSNTLYLWNGHPFTSILRLPKYPEAQEVPTEQLDKNIGLFKWLCDEADKRGIWVVQFFYNIHISHELARHHNIAYTHKVPTPLTRDYTSYCITEFIKNYPNVGLMMCLGEDLADEYDAEWLSDVIIPGVKAGLKPGQANPPIIVRGHSTPLKEVLTKASPLYDNIYTMAKYTGETLASDKVAGGDEPNAQVGGWKQRKQLADKYMLIINVHCVCNLEPFRWGSPTFVQNAMQSCQQIGVKGLHLYPLRYWDWPYTADIVDPPLMQPDRDWIWYATWARYAWNPYRDKKQERAFWIDQIGSRYGSQKAGEHILDAYELSGDVMPHIVRRVSAEAWNCEAHAQGQTLEQFVYSQPWFADPEESITLYAKRQATGQKHKGESPIAAMEKIVKDSQAALDAAIAAEPYVKQNKQEYKRLVNDMRALSLIARFYKHKTDATIRGMMFLDTVDVANLDESVEDLKKSVEVYRELAVVTKDAYRDIASHHSPTRVIPFPIKEGLVWSDVVHLYEEELSWYKGMVDMMRKGVALLKTPVTPYPPVEVSCPDKSNLYRIEKDAIIDTNVSASMKKVPDEFIGLNSIRMSLWKSHQSEVKENEVDLSQANTSKENAYKLEFTADEPVRVFVGFALRWWRWISLPEDWKVPEGWTLYVRNSATIDTNSAGDRDCDIYYCDFPAGTSTIEFTDGPVVVFGFTRPDAPLVPVAKRYYGPQMFIQPRP